MMRVVLVFVVMWFGMVATAAQEQPPEQQSFLAEALAVLQRQRDEAMNAVVNAEARASLLMKQNRALAERVKTLEAKINQEPKQ